MTKSENPIAIEPLTKAEEQKQHGNTAKPDVKDMPLPKEWKEKMGIMTEAVTKGFRYYRRRVGDKYYMLLRKGKKDISLGAWTPEKDGKLFRLFPNLGTYAGIPKPAPWSDAAGYQQGRSFLAVPIARTAIIPRDYIPSINVIRYFQIIKNNGFPGDFSQFINDMVTHHLEDCHGIRLPVMLEEEMAEYREREENIQNE